MLQYPSEEEFIHKLHLHLLMKDISATAIYSWLRLYKGTVLR